MSSVLRSALAWIEHWQRDVECGLKPTPESLAMAAAELCAALSQPQPLSKAERFTGDYQASFAA